MDSRRGQFGSPAPSSQIGPGRQVAGAAYRFLPVVAMSVAALVVLLTVAEALLPRYQTAAPHPSAAPTAAHATPPAAIAADTPSPVAPNTPSPAGAEEGRGEGTSSSVTSPPLPSPSAAADILPSTHGASPVPTASAPAPADLRATWLEARRVRMQGRVAAPDGQVDYWFLIRQPGASGYFRQGPARLTADGAFQYDITDWPVASGGDAVTLAAVARDTSDAWLREYFRIGTWLPRIEVRPGDGIAFLEEISL